MPHPFLAAWIGIVALGQFYNVVATHENMSKGVPAFRIISAGACCASALAAYYLGFGI